jgi:hypothetical protein
MEITFDYGCFLTLKAEDGRDVLWFNDFITGISLEYIDFFESFIECFAEKNSGYDLDKPILLRDIKKEGFVPVGRIDINSNGFHTCESMFRCIEKIYLELKQKYASKKEKI